MRTYPERLALWILSSMAAACAAFTIGGVSYQIGRNVERANSHYAARLAVSLCRTDTECEHAAYFAESIGVRPPLYLTGQEAADLSLDSRD